MLFLKILVAVDGSESSNKVYNTSAQLAKLSNGKLVIVHLVVTPPLPLSGGLFYPDVSGIDIRYESIWKKLEGGFYRIILKSQQMSTALKLKPLWLTVIRQMLSLDRQMQEVLHNLCQKQRIQRGQAIFYWEHTKFNLTSFKYSCPACEIKHICIEMKIRHLIKISAFHAVITYFLVVSTSCVLQIY